MNTTDYLLNGLLVLAVFKQLKGKRLVGATLFIPLGVVAFVGTKYLHSVPTHGTGLALVALGVGAGLALGVLCGLFSLVYPDRDGVPFVRATGLAAGLWIAGVGARLAFQLYAEHGGGPEIARFSAAHSLSMQAWVAALILMSLTEVVSRTLVLVVRSRRLAGGSGDAIMTFS